MPEIDPMISLVLQSNNPLWLNKLFIIIIIIIIIAVVVVIIKNMVMTPFGVLNGYDIYPFHGESLLS